MNRLAKDIQTTLLKEFKSKSIKSDFDCFEKAHKIYDEYCVLKYHPENLKTNELFKLMDYLQLKEINLTNIKICKR